MGSFSFIDAHCHLSDERVFAQADQLILNARVKGVSRVMIGGVNPSDWARQKSLFEKYPEQVRCAFGIHPWSVEKENRAQIENDLEILKQEISFAHALGETGLDFHQKRDVSRFADQEFAFRAQIQIAKVHQKPLVLHIVSSHERAISILKEEGFPEVPIQVHSFSGSPELAIEWLKLGAFLSFSGAFLRPGREKAKHSLSLTPLSQLLLETDSPDQAWREDGQNEPALVPELYQGAAQRLGVSIEILQEKLAENFAHFG